MKIVPALIIFLLLSMLNCRAQFVSFGQDRPSLRWKQINTDNFQIIYPDFYEINAQKAANIFEQLYRHANTLNCIPRKISVILHADGGESNGNVALAPRKSELYTAPPQDPADNWLEQLCIHEFRHVVQLDKVNQGLTRKLYYIFGEILPIAVTGLYVPMWFVEGDAVSFETSVCHIGRGRSPEFLNEMKAQIVEKGIYSYYKAVLGSYKDYVPNRYNLGYFMTANTRANYGTEIWADALQRCGRRPYGMSPYSKSLNLTMKGRRDSLWNTPAFHALFANPDSVRRANTHHMGQRTLYHDNFSELQQIWKRDAATVRMDFDTITTHDRYYTGYYYPTPVSPESMIAYRMGLSETGAFVKLSGNRSRTLVRTGVMSDYKFATDGNSIVWSEYHPSVRWQLGGRQALCSYDMERRKYVRHKAANNRMAPFRAGKGWGCVETDNSNQAFLVVLDSTLRHETWRFAAGKDELFIHPACDAQGDIITVVQTPEGLHLEKIDTATRQRSRLTGTMAYEIDNPFPLSNGDVIYRASFSGNNSFYRQTPGGHPVNILNSPWGVRFPTLRAQGDSLCFSFYTSDGYKPGRIAMTDLAADTVDPVTYRLAQVVKKQEDWRLPIGGDSLYTTRKYNKLTHLVNVHSWGPLYTDLNAGEVDLGLVVYSQNKLSTLSFTAGYISDRAYEHGAWLLKGTYSGWWPVIDFSVMSGKDRDRQITQALSNASNSTERVLVESRAQRSTLSLTARVPLNLSVRNFNRSLQPFVRYKTEGLHNHHPRNVWNIAGEQNRNNYDLHLPARFYQLMEYGIQFNNQTRMTDQESNPRWGQFLSGGFSHTLHKGMDLGYQWWADTRYYFPGFLLNHSVTLYGGFQYMSESDRFYSNKLLQPRGINLNGHKVSSMRTTYRLPLFYPDQNVSSLVYFKGIDCAFFGDMGTEHTATDEKIYWSSGVELTTDTHFFRITSPVHLGVRVGYENQTRKAFANLIFSIGLSI